MKITQLILTLLIFCFSASAKEYHVSKNGNDNNPGSFEDSFKTIQAAANIAQPGDVITVHEGVYRERVTPPRGGESDTKRITYRAAEGEKVEIKGSEIINGWKKFAPGVWKVTLSNSFFGDYNPYKDIINGDWFSDLGRDHHTGEVYLNGKSLYESDILEGVLNPKPMEGISDQEGSTYTWYCENDNDNTFIYANFHDADPNQGMVEINVRNSCFYPDTTGRNYITIRGFHMSQAATQWAAPTAEQIGLIGTFWSKGWIIENNVISDSKCSGITLGKDRKSGHNVWSNDPCKGGADHYNEVIERVLEDGWSKEKIGSHIVRNNVIFNCEQTGICGSLGAAFSQIINNHIYNIWTKRQFTGSELGGIKIHASIDVLIKNNKLNNVRRAIWLDWMAQGTRVSGNLCYNNIIDDMFVEVNHGPFLIDNNIFLSELSLRDWSQGGTFVHNLITGNIELSPQSRTTPYHLPHSTQLAGLKKTFCGDDRFYNNIFVAGVPEKSGRYSGLKLYNNAELPMFVDGNIYLNGANRYNKESNFLQNEYDPEIEVIEDGENVYLYIKLDKSIHKMKNQLVTTQLLGKALIPNQWYENPNGSPLTIDYDYFGNRRDKRNPTAGPFENPGNGKLKLKVK